MHLIFTMCLFMSLEIYIYWISFLDMFYFYKGFLCNKSMYEGLSSPCLMIIWVSFFLESLQFSEGPARAMLGNLERLCPQVKMYRNIVPKQGEGRDCFSLCLMHKVWRYNADPIGSPVAPCSFSSSDKKDILCKWDCHIFGTVREYASKSRAE